MKKILTMILLGSITIFNAQVIMGDALGTAAVKTSVLLEFAANQNKGIIVPYVRTLPTGAAEVGGSIILDASTATDAKMKFYNGTSWVDLSGQGADLSSTGLNVMASQPTTALPPETAAGSKVIIGAAASAADGILVLESSDKAMVLPIVTDVQLIPKPSPGMMVYVSGVTPDFKKRLAVFNGSKWSFWKPTS